MTRSTTYDFLLTFRSNWMGLFRTVSEINDDFSRKSQNFPGSSVLDASHRWKGFPCNWVSAPGFKKTRMMGLPGR